MSDIDVILALGKVITAAAWADGEISREEINSLKDLLFRAPRAVYDRDLQINGREWALMEMYMESPVDPEERVRLIEELKATLRTPQDRELAQAALEELVQADGAVSDEEREVLNEITSAIGSADTGIVGHLSRLIRGPVQRRSLAAANAPSREEFLDDFIRNKVYYSVRQRLDLGDAELGIADSELRKLSLAGGLMARVADVDEDVTEEEFDVMVTALQEGWEINYEAAVLVTEIAVSEVAADLDYYRLTREFFSCTSEDERVRFLDVLFAVANADDGISFEETEEIRDVATSLNLTHRQFINAKLKFIDA